VGRKTGPALTRERIIEVALREVDEHGLSELTMRGLGGKLGVQGMALYHHFRNKEQIVDSLVGVLMSQVDLVEDEAKWDVRILKTHESLRRVLLAHPNLLPAVIMRPFNTPEAVGISDEILAVLLTAGFGRDDALYAYQTLRAYVLGYTLTETVGLIGDPPKWDNRDRMTIQDYGDYGFVHLLEVVPSAATYDHDEEFGSGLDAVIEGIRMRLFQSRRSPSDEVCLGPQALTS
jgi:TetR/AcrR family transcriptional regulator, tetracycline repressor protein